MRHYYKRLRLNTTSAEIDLFPHMPEALSCFTTANMDDRNGINTYISFLSVVRKLSISEAKEFIINICDAFYQKDFERLNTLRRQYHADRASDVQVCFTQPIFLQSIPQESYANPTTTIAFLLLLFENYKTHDTPIPQDIFEALPDNLLHFHPALKDISRHTQHISREHILEGNKNTFREKFLFNLESIHKTFLDSDINTKITSHLQLTPHSITQYEELKENLCQLFEKQLPFYKNFDFTQIGHTHTLLPEHRECYALCYSQNQIKKIIDLLYKLSPSLRTQLVALQQRSTSQDAGHFTAVANIIRLASKPKDMSKPNRFIGNCIYLIENDLLLSALVASPRGTTLSPLVNQLRVAANIFSKHSIDYSAVRSADRDLGPTYPFMAYYASLLDRYSAELSKGATDSYTFKKIAFKGAFAYKILHNLSDMYGMDASKIPSIKQFEAKYLEAKGSKFKFSIDNIKKDDGSEIVTAFESMQEIQIYTGQEDRDEFRELREKLEKMKDKYLYDAPLVIAKKRLLKELAKAKSYTMLGAACVLICVLGLFYSGIISLFSGACLSIATVLGAYLLIQSQQSQYTQTVFKIKTGLDKARAKLPSMPEQSRDFVYAATSQPPEASSSDYQP